MICKKIVIASNVKCGKETQIIDLLHLIQTIFQKKSDIIYDKKRDIDNIRRRVINIDKAKSLLNWEPEYTMKQGLIKTVKWFKRD